jgi:hypothetical protein
LFTGKIFQGPADIRRFLVLFFATGYPFQLGASAVELRRMANQSGPTRIVPGHPDGNMPQREFHRAEV